MVRQAVVGRIKPGGENEIGVGLGDGHAGVFDFLRQASLCRSNSILHIHGCNVQVVTGAERHIDVAGAVVGAGRGDVVHSLDAIDLLFQRSGNCRLDHVCVGADVIAGDCNLGRRQIRI